MNRRRRAVRIARVLVREINWKKVAAVALAVGVTVCFARLGGEEEIEATTYPAENEQAKQELRMQQEYGCNLYGQYEYPYNTMSQDWSGDQVKGFYYHEITEECKRAGGQLPVIMQVYTYIVCEQSGVDYEMVFALIERESRCVWNATGDGGVSVGLMQIAEKWQQERMEKLYCTDLMQPFQNVRVGVDILAELQEKLKGTVPDEQLPYDVLAAYNYGLRGARENLWAYGVHEYEYNKAIMERAKELKQETKAAKEGRE